MTLLPCCPGGLRRFSLSRVQCEIHFSPLRKSFSPSRRHWRQRGSELLAIPSSMLLPASAGKRSRMLPGLGVYTVPKAFGISLPPPSHQTGFRDEGTGFSTSLACTLYSAPYTLRLFGARQPLCGIGVTSLISVISRPTFIRVR